MRATRGPWGACVPCALVLLSSLVAPSAAGSILVPYFDMYRTTPTPSTIGYQCAAGDLNGDVRARVDGRAQQVMVCTRCIRGNKIEKALRGKMTAAV